MENGGYEAMMHELVNYQPANGDWGFLRSAPKTIHLQEQQEHTLRGTERFMYDLLREGTYEPINDNVEPIVLNEHTQTRVEGVELRKAIDDYLEHGPAFQKDDCKLPKIRKMAEKWLGASEVKENREDRTYAVSVLVFPPLKEARARAAIRHGVIFGEKLESSDNAANDNADEHEPKGTRKRR